MIPHIVLEIHEEFGLVLRTDDSEIGDYLDDILTEEHHIVYDWVRNFDTNGVEMCFGNSHSFDRFKTILTNLDIK